MFKFLEMMNNYEERNVKNTEVGKAIIDTSAINDSSKPYETGIQHPEYNKGDWIIVELYNTKEEAEKGHYKWVQKFSGKKLPASLIDVSTCDIMDVARSYGYEFKRVFKKGDN